uniref:Glycosyltransferase family 92 protein n=1 Tax=Photinus pyralis TaxID=7054 RepID=A0A1Y1NK64_PHOPY
MKKYRQLLLLIITVVSVSLLLVYRHEYNRLHYVLEVFNFFGKPCNISSLETSENVLGYHDWGPESLWQETENIYIYSAFWNKDYEAQAIVLHTGKAEVAKSCYLWFEDKEKPTPGKFRYAEVENDKVNGQTAFFYYCSLTTTLHKPYAVSFAVKNKKIGELKKVHLTVSRAHTQKVNTVICVSPTDFNKSFFVEFLSYHKLVGVENFIFYQSNIPHRLIKIVHNLSNRLGINTHFRSWNFPKTEGALSRTIVEKDCILRTANYSDNSITLELNEFIVPSGHFIYFNETFNASKKMPDRISLPVQTFCVDNSARRKPITLQNVDVSYNNDNKVRYVYRLFSEQSAVVTHAVVKDVISIHKYIRCTQKPVRVYRDSSMLRFSVDLTRSTLVQLYLHNDL